MPQRKIKRVSDEHTRDRVRKNQRQHRARRRDYIATLERKLEEAEQTISSLREQVKSLENDGNGDIRSSDAFLVNTSNSREETSTIEDNQLAFGASLGSDISLSITSPVLVPEPVLTYPTPEFLPEITDTTYSLENLQIPISTAGLLMDPTTNSLCQESTILCSEAYILIAHQNYKNLSESTIAAFLWPSFRASTSPNEGCRVVTSALYTLLAFISN